MATVRDVIAGAYRRLGLLAPGEDIDPDRVMAGLEMFNDLLASLQAEGSTDPAPVALSAGNFDSGLTNDGIGSQSTPETGIAMDLTPPYGLNDMFPLADKHVQGVKALLAVQLAPECGQEASATIQRAAERGRKLIIADYVKAPASQQDPGLTWMPSLRRYGFR